MPPIWRGRVEIFVLTGILRRSATPFHIISVTTVPNSSAKYLAIIAKSSPDGQLTFDMVTLGKIGGVRPGFPSVAGVSVWLVVMKRGIPLMVAGHGLDGSFLHLTTMNDALIETSNTPSKRLLMRAMCSFEGIRGGPDPSRMRGWFSKTMCLVFLIFRDGGSSRRSG